jgi:hypothetical protein
MICHSLHRRLEYGTGRNANSSIGDDDVQTACNMFDLGHIARGELYDLDLVWVFDSKRFKLRRRLARAGKDDNIVALCESANESKTW